jgi:isoquinoline 1-oxidoreductase beta subunit
VTATLPTPAHPRSSGVSRRGFLGWVLGGTTLVVAADLSLGETAFAAVPGAPQIAESYDLEDAQTDSARPTSQLITITINQDGTASFALHRTEVGQGITTSTAMIIAEELDLPVERVHVTLAPARPELEFNQLTGGSNTTVSTYTPIRVAAAIAKGALLDAAALELGSAVALLESKNGVVTAPDGSSVSYADLAEKAASPSTRPVQVDLKPAGDFTVIGTPQKRLDARDIVTGQKKFAMDLDVVPGATPTMLCRPPTLNGRPRAILNRAEVLALPGVTDLAILPTGVAVGAKTFGQCIDGVRALRVDWEKGSVEGESDATILKELKAAEVPLAVPKVPALARTIDADFSFMFKSSAALEPYAAVADVKPDSAEVWAGLKVPIVAQMDIADAVGLPKDKVKVNVITGGGSFGHKLFANHAIEAARASKAFGKPVRLMWHRADEPRQGRNHPMATSRIRATYLAGQVLSFEQRHTSVATDFSHGFGEMISALGGRLPAGLGNLGYAETIFALTQDLSYDFGVVSQVLDETDSRFNTGSMRNIYSPDVRTASELVVDQLARALGKDPLAFRLAFVKDARVRNVLQQVAKAADWGRPMAPGTAQGLAVHKEYKGASACVVEIDCRPETVNRKVRDGVTGPRVTRATIGIDAGLVINPTGLEAQLMGGFSDGMALTLTSSVHLQDGHFLEASWDNYFYTRQWNVPPRFDALVVDSGSEQPGGAGEAGVACSAAAVACAYARATGRMPTKFPINHDDPLAFEVKPFEPPVPASPTDGLSFTY